MPRLSVVTTVYNEQARLKVSLNSILNQTYDDFEFIIVDDGSTDQSFNIMSDVHESTFRDPRIRIIKLDKNVGRAAAANIGIAQAKGSLIARHDADDISLPRRFELQTARFSPQIGAVGGAINTSNGIQHHPAVITKEIYRKMHINHPTLMFRTEYFGLAQGYDEKLIRCSDWDFCCRLYKAGCSMVNIAEPLVEYHTPPEDPQYYRDVHIVMGRWAEEWKRLT